MVSERRSSPRVRAPEGAEGLIRSTIQVRVEDISRTGARFVLSSVVRPGSTYAFHAELEGFDLSVPIRITRCKAGSVSKAGGGGQTLVFHAGAEFMWANADLEQRFIAWLDGRGPGSAQIQAKLQG